MQMCVRLSRRPMGLALCAGLAVLGVMVAAPAAHAGIPPVTGGGTLTFTQDTVLNTTTVRFLGSINTTGLTVVATGSFPFNARMYPAVGEIQFGPGIATGITYNLNADIWPAFATANMGQSTGTFLGPDRIGFIANGSQDLFRVSDTYVSGSAIDAAMQFTGTFATLNIQPGNYSATLPGNGPITYVFNTIPAPGAAAMLLAGGLVVGGRRRR